MIELSLNSSNRDELIRTSKFIEYLKNEIFSNCRLYEITKQLNDNIEEYKKFEFEESEFMYKYDELSQKLDLDLYNIDIKFALFKNEKDSINNYITGDKYSFIVISVPVNIIESESIEIFDNWANTSGKNSIIEINEQIENLKLEYNRLLNACFDPE